MNKLEQAALARAERRAVFEPMVRAYPNLGEADLEALLSWCRSEASAHDLAMLSTNADLAEGYSQLKADHLDRISPTEYMRFAAILLAIFAILAALVWLAIG